MAFEYTNTLWSLELPP